MEDKRIDLIKEEIEKRIANLKKWNQGCTAEEAQFYDGEQFALEEILNYINSL